MSCRAKGTSAGRPTPAPDQWGVSQVRVDYDRAGLRKGVTVTLFIDDREVATGRIDHTMGAVGAAHWAPHPRTRESAEL